MFSELVAKEDQLTPIRFRLSGPWPPYYFVRMDFAVTMLSCGSWNRALRSLPSLYDLLP